MGLGDDILVFDVPSVAAVSVDGGDGANVIKVSNSHGTTALNTFAMFENFQTYEVEGVNDTQHDFATMSGVESVIIATDLPPGPPAGADTQLINLAANQDVTVSGKNQTSGAGNSTNNQLFDVIRLTDDSGASRLITLDNTARLSQLDADGNRLDGEMTVETILIDETEDGVSNTRTVTIDSAGQRNTANIVNDFQGEEVTTLNLQGTQDLSIHVSNIATEPVTGGNSPAFSIDGSSLAADLELAMDVTLLSRGNADQITGTDSENDELQFYGVNPGANGAATIAGFETIQFGAPFAATFLQSEGTFDTANVSGADLYDFESLSAATELVNLSGEVNAEVNGVAADQNLTFDAADEAGSNVLNIEIEGAGYNRTLETDDIRTVNVDLTSTAPAGFADNFNFEVETDEYARTLAFSGGEDEDGVVDTLTLTGPLENSLATIDFSEFVGQLGFLGDIILADAAVGDITNTTVLLNGYEASIDDQSADLAGGGSTVTTFRFTTDAVDVDEDWTIDGFRTFAENDLSTLSILDMRDLGVETLSDIDIDYATGDAVITSNEGLDFEIVLLGIDGTGTNTLNNENFVFAV
jgi:hypothetical protein